MADAAKPDFWGVNDPDQLEYTDKDEAIEAFLDGMASDGDLPDTVEVTAYRKLEIPVESNATSALDSLLEYLDEEYGDPDGDYSKPTEKMKAAARAFVAAVKEEYEVFQCERIPGTTEIVNVGEWLSRMTPPPPKVESLPQ